MFRNPLKNVSKPTIDPDMFRNHFSDSEIESEAEKEARLAPCAKSYSCLFQPVYRLDGRYFVASGFKVIAQPNSDEANDFRLEPENVETSSVDLLRTLDMGSCQFQVIKAQVDTFLSQKTKRQHHKLMFEIDIYEFSDNPSNLSRLRRIIEDAVMRGISESDIVVEVSGATSLDPGIVYTIATRIKEMGVMIALINMDADCFSFKRVFQIWPHIVKFNRSWSDLPVHDEQYVEMVKTLVSAIHAKGICTIMSSVRTDQDLHFVAKCGFSRCQGSYFGSATKTMELPHPHLARFH